VCGGRAGLIRIRAARWTFEATEHVISGRWCIRKSRCIEAQIRSRTEKWVAGCARSARPLALTVSREPAWARPRRVVPWWTMRAFWRAFESIAAGRLDGPECIPRARWVSQGSAAGGWRGGASVQSLERRGPPLRRRARERRNEGYRDCPLPPATVHRGAWSTSIPMQVSMVRPRALRVLGLRRRCIGLAQVDRRIDSGGWRRTATCPGAHDPPTPSLVASRNSPRGRLARPDAQTALVPRWPDLCSAPHARPMP
jgi:hypothetical protein